MRKLALVLTLLATPAAATSDTTTMKPSFVGHVRKICAVLAGVGGSSGKACGAMASGSMYDA